MPRLYPVAETESAAVSCDYSHHGYYLTVDVFHHRRQRWTPWLTFFVASSASLFPGPAPSTLVLTVTRCAGPATPSSSSARLAGTVFFDPVLYGTTRQTRVLLSKGRPLVRAFGV